MPKQEVDTKRLARRAVGGPHVMLSDVKDRLVERIEHRVLDFILDVESKKYSLRVAFFDIEKPTTDGATLHERSANLTFAYKGEVPTESERAAIELFVVHHMKLAQAITVYVTGNEPPAPSEKTEFTGSSQIRRAIKPAHTKENT